MLPPALAIRFFLLHAKTMQEPTGTSTETQAILQNVTVFVRTKKILEFDDTTDVDNILRTLGITSSWRL